jgi:hypothetical protein
MWFHRAIAAVFLFSDLFASGDVKQVEKIAEMHQLLGEVDDQCLIVFDIDDVIISTEDHFSHPYGYLKFIELTDQALSSAATKEEKEEVMRKASLSQLLAKRRLVEESMPELIENLQKTGVKVIALTNFPRGQYGAISRAETWRIEQLKDFGVDFSVAFPEESGYEFQEMTRPGIPSPLFEGGILFSHGFSKGDVLTAFFMKTQFYPSKVIFIDDLLYHHHSVQSALTSLEVPFLGIHYVGASKHFGVCNEPLLRYQFDHLLSTSTWLSDKFILELWSQAQEEPKEP